MAPVFTFNRFPTEIRLLIWPLALPDHEPEIFVLEDSHMQSRLDTADGPPEPMTVDTAFPAVLHTCHESRNSVLWDSRLRLRFSPEAAIPSTTSFGSLGAMQEIADQCPELLSFSFVFHDSKIGDVHPAWDSTSAAGNRVPTEPFVELRRRSKLRRINPDLADATNIWEWVPERRTTVGEFYRLFLGRLDRHGENAHGPEDDSSNTEPDPPGAVLCFAQSFVKWQSGEWVEMFGW
ncbi:hypothetical protein N658DRAFT_482022 [Parathielavia hyrcaniae]|uniref:2EXR domain-containing protein n=1 Tax=Parathielavia hyrcaniae TaxID=113614 RepID=A0AAN6Q9J2_9PEZI|nr:hypothetical protein N658DRAFT_482022 [Parathielavia hyrcaniae]